ncbi:MAG TPA: ABC transporter permease [Candidatus Dormibacteraeota bacterium]|nr:ABC transporter permease [Candidatus Dormibacteraeota bacterium]
MSLLRTFQTGLRGIAAHRLRSILTTLGILFGVAAVIATVGIGQASTDSVNSRIASLGTNELTITGGSSVSAGVQGGAGSAATLTMADVTGLQDQVGAPDILAVAPENQTSSTIVNGSLNSTSTVQGSTAGWLTANSRSLSEGTFFTSSNVTKHSLVVVLGATTASTLGATVGSQVDIANTPFTVIGILTSTGSSGFTNQDDLAVIPISTDQDLLAGQGKVQRIVIASTSTTTIGSAYNEADQLLLQTHHITNPASADFTIVSQSSFLSTAQSVTATLTLLLASIAAISLLVGGIGVMNIMLVTVTERTGEIGLRKALGATPRDIRRQFLIEASTLSVVGGMMGVITAFVVGIVVPRVTTIGVDIRPAPVIVAVAVAAGVGLIFGVYPATRAAKLTPITALRSQ